MARIAGIDLPRDKRVEIGITYIFGIGLTSARKVLEATGIDPETRVRDLTDREITKLRQSIENDYQVEGALRGDITLQYPPFDGYRVLPGLAASPWAAGAGTADPYQFPHKKGTAPDDRREAFEELVTNNIPWR